MDTKSIRCFEAVYEEQSVNQAAKQLFITPQGLSKIIFNLEEELGTTLFTRTKKGMVPTESGIYFYSQCHKFLHMLEQLKSNLRQIEERSSLLRLGMAYGTVNVFSPDILIRFQQSISQTQINLELNEELNEELIKKVLSGKTDIGFAIGPIKYPDLESIELFHCSVDAIVYEGHPLYHASAISIEDLRGEALICLNEKFSIYHSLLRRCSDFGFIPSIAVKTLDSQLIYRFCREKMGIGIDVDIHKGPDLLGSLHRIRITNAFPWKISAICRKDRLAEPLIANMLAQLKKQAL